MAQLPSRTRFRPPVMAALAIVFLGIYLAYFG
jgi:hypothetical protein